MTSPPWNPDEDDEGEWGVGVYPAVVPQEPDLGAQAHKRLQAKKDGERIAEEVYALLRKAHDPHR